MHTYLKVLFAADGAKPSVVSAALLQLGFRPIHGAHDFIYDWQEEADVSEVLHFGDAIHAELQETGCLFELETV